MDAKNDHGYFVVHFGKNTKTHRIQGLKNLYSLENFEEITYLSVHDDIDMIPEGLPMSLVVLDFSNSNITKIANIEHLINLKYLTVSCTDVKKIEHLPQNLEHFFAVETRISIVENLNEGLLVADFCDCGFGNLLIIKEVPSSLISMGTHHINEIKWECENPEKLTVYHK